MRDDPRSHLFVPRAFSGEVETGSPKKMRKIQDALLSLQGDVGLAPKPTSIATCYLLIGLEEPDEDPAPDAPVPAPLLLVL